MADAKITDLVELVTPDGADVMVIVDDSVVPKTTKKITVSNLIDPLVSANADVSANTAHRTSDGKDHSDVVLNNSHRASDGKDHSDVVLNNAHRVSDGKDHSDVVLNNAHRAATGNPHSATTDNIPQGTTNKYYAPAWLQYSNNVLQNTATNVDINFGTDQGSLPGGKFTKLSPTEFRADFAGYVEVHYSVSVFSGTNNAGFYVTVKKNGTLQPFTERGEITRTATAEKGTVSGIFAFSCAVNDTFSINLSSPEGATLSLNPNRAHCFVKVLRE